MSVNSRVQLLAVKARHHKSVSWVNFHDGKANRLKVFEKMDLVEPGFTFKPYVSFKEI